MDIIWSYILSEDLLSRDEKLFFMKDLIFSFLSLTYFSFFKIEDTSVNKCSSFLTLKVAPCLINYKS